MGKEIENKAMTTVASSLGERERQSLIIEFNNSAAAYPADQTIVELFEAQAALTPNEEAVRLDKQSLTYCQLNERANRVAAHLRSLGAGPERFVALYMEHSVEVVVAILGVLKAGAAYVPVDPACTPTERLAFILQDLQEVSQGASAGGALPLLVTQSRLVTGSLHGMAQAVTLDNDFSQIEKYSPANPKLAASPRNLAYVIYTSGSTGKPKGVLIEHRSLVNYIWSVSYTHLTLPTIYSV